MNSRYRPAITATGPRLPRACIWVLKAALPLALVAACAVSETPVSVGDGFPDAGASTPAFTPPPEAGSADVSVPAQNMCIDTECPAPLGTCTSSRFKCDIDFSSDSSNCGGCGIVCPNYDIIRLATQCSNGVCVAHCGAEALDCNGLVDDGCEALVKLDPKNCGACGNACGPGVPCLDGKCGCTLPKSLCNGSCVDLSTNAANCGACGNVCDHSGLPTPPPHMGYSCSAGECGHIGCIEGWADCNDDWRTKGYESDGCETPLDAEPNCGSCGKTCGDGQRCEYQPQAGGYTCICGPNETECVGARCVDILTDPTNCGGCGIICPGASSSAVPTHVTAVCRSGVCGLDCDVGWSDCDSNPANGCEVNISRDPNHCGSCTNACNSSEGQPCVGGVCLTKPCDEGPTK